MPFPIERYRYDIAKKGFEKLISYCDIVVAIDNTKLAKVAGTCPCSRPWAWPTSSLASSSRA